MELNYKLITVPEREREKVLERYLNDNIIKNFIKIIADFHSYNYSQILIKDNSIEFLYDTKIQESIDRVKEQMNEYVKEKYGKYIKITGE